MTFLNYLHILPGTTSGRGTTNTITVVSFVTGSDHWAAKNAE